MEHRPIRSERRAGSRPSEPSADGHPFHEIPRVRLELSMQILWSVVNAVLHLGVEIRSVRRRVARPVGTISPHPELRLRIRRLAALAPAGGDPFPVPRLDNL